MKWEEQLSSDQLGLVAGGGGGEAVTMATALGGNNSQGPVQSLSNSGTTITVVATAQGNQTILQVINNNKNNTSGDTYLTLYCQHLNISDKFRKSGIIKNWFGCEFKQYYLHFKIFSKCLTKKYNAFSLNVKKNLFKLSFLFQKLTNEYKNSYFHWLFVKSCVPQYLYFL